jgi:molybdopterin converting factor small subunit
MAQIFIPANLRQLTEGREIVDVSGANVRDVVDGLESQFPGIKDRLCQGDRLRPGISVAVGGEVSSLGLLQRVEDESEVHFLPAIAGG